MTVEELRKKMIEDLEPAFFIGGFGGAMLEFEEIKKASKEKVIEIAKKKGYIKSEEEVEDNPKVKRFWQILKLMLK